MLEGAEAGDGGEERGAKNAATLTRGAATPSGAFNLKELILRSEPPKDISTYDAVPHVLQGSVPQINYY